MSASRQRQETCTSSLAEFAFGPFAQVAIDIIGPLPVCKESGNRFILTVLDLCSHYPEAIPLKQHTAAEVAQALGTVSSRFGFPQEILSDQGSDFMSELM